MSTHIVVYNCIYYLQLYTTIYHFALVDRSGQEDAITGHIERWKRLVCIASQKLLTAHKRISPSFDNLACFSASEMGALVLAAKVFER